MLNSPQILTGLLSQLKEQTLQTPMDLKLLLRLARLYMKNSNYIEAERVFKKCIKSFPDNAEIMVEYAICLIKDSKYDDAEVELERALSIKPGMVQAFLTCATLYEKTGNINKQISFMMLAANAAPENFDIRLSLAEQLRKYGDFNGAISQYDQILAFNPDQETACFSKGLILMKQEKLTEANQCFIRIINNNPSAFDAHFNLASCYYRQGKYAAAINHFRISSRSKDLANRSLYLMAQCFSKRNDFDQAIVAMEKLVAVDNKNLSYQKALGEFYEGAEEYDMASEIYYDLTLLAPTRSEFWLKLAHCQIKNKDFQKAEKTLNKVFRVEPGHVEGHKVLAELYAAKHLYKEAIEEFQRILMLKENDGELYLSLAKVYREIDREVDEMEALNQAVINGKETAAALLRLGELERKYKLPTSIERFKRIKDLSPDS
ncbi:MAG: tetratricopeptide repeat protein, partial [Candidatus Riflebacteria bacterium]|nr:tetratricopeptide repeat protein [Candidatus Riflebacteria bacterium]